MEMENRLLNEVIAMEQAIRGLQKTHAEISYRMTSNCEAWSLQVAAASNKIQKIEQHVQKIETQFLDDASTSEELTKDVSTLMNDTRGLNLVVDNVRNYVPCEEAIGEKHKVRSRSPTSQNCTLNTLGNDQECLKKGTTNNVLILDLQTEESLSHNIKQEETSMISQESSTGRLRRRSQDEFEVGLFDMDQQRTITEWIKYTNQVIAHASFRIESGLVKIGGSLDVILVLDTSERMAGYFRKMKSTVIQYVKGKLKPEGDAHIIGGLLMGLAGVVSCGVGYMQDTALQPHIIVFTNGSSDQNMPSVDLDDDLVVTFGNLPVKPDVNGVMNMIACTTTKIFYVPVGGNYHNITLEKAVKTTNGKIIPDDEIIRLTLMSKVLKIAMDIASEIRYTNNHSREVIRRLLADKHNFSDRYDDCLDMVPDFINPLRYANKQGKYMELKCNTLKLGDRVRRRPDCICSDQDLDLPGTVIGQDRCDSIWIEWDNGQRLGYVFDECTNIYQIIKVNEARILVNEMIAVGCRVVRGPDWRYGYFDGGKGSLGTVLEVKDKSKVVVRWDGTNTGVFKIGYDGLFEVVLFDDFVNNENSRRYIKPSKHCFARQQEHHNLGTRSDEPLDCVVTYSDIFD